MNKRVCKAVYISPSLYTLSDLMHVKQIETSYTDVTLFFSDPMQLRRIPVLVTDTAVIELVYNAFTPNTFDLINRIAGKYTGKETVYGKAIIMKYERKNSGFNGLDFDLQEWRCIHNMFDHRFMLPDTVTETMSEPERKLVAMVNYYKQFNVIRHVPDMDMTPRRNPSRKAKKRKLDDSSECHDTVSEDVIEE